MEEEKAQKEERYLRDRQIFYGIYDHFWVRGTHESILDFTDLMSVSLRGDDVQGFHTRWDEVLFFDRGRSIGQNSGKPAISPKMITEFLVAEEMFFRIN